MGDVVKEPFCNPLLTTGQAARFCRVAPRTISKWSDAGKLPCRREEGSNNRLIHVQDLADFMFDNGLEIPKELTQMVHEAEIIRRDRARTQCSGGVGPTVKTIIVNLSDEQLKKLDEVAELLMINMEACLNACIRLAVAHLSAAGGGSGLAIIDEQGEDHTIQFGLTQQTIDHVASRQAEGNVDVPEAILAVAGLGIMANDLAEDLA